MLTTAANLPYINRSSLDGVVQHLGDPSRFAIDQVRLEKAFGRLEPFSGHLHHAAIW